MTYAQKLRDPLWQKKRLSIFSRDNWTCKSCGRNDITLHVHHLVYLPELNPWEYEDYYLITYCEICHETEHLIGDQIRESLIEVIRQKPLFIKPLSQISILCEEYPPFIDMVRKFLQESTILYLQDMKNQTNGERSGNPMVLE
jgi:hypothetical protein